MAITVVDGGEHAIIFDRFSGVQDRTYGEGIGFLIPFLQYPIIYDVRTRPSLTPTQSPTKDQQMADLKVRVLTRPDIKHLPTIYKTYGKSVDELVLPSIVNEVMKATVAQYNAEQLLTNRDQVSEQIRVELSKRAESFHIKLEDVAITHLAYSREFARACEAKQVAFQEAERSKYLVERAEQEKKAAIVKAEGEAEAAKLISEATKRAGPGMIELRRIEAAKEISSNLSKSRNVSYLPGGSNMMMAMSMGQGQGQV